MVCRMRNGASQKTIGGRSFIGLTARGRKALTAEADNWNRLAQAIARVMETA
jgi:hypothetical protein